MFLLPLLLLLFFIINIIFTLSHIPSSSNIAFFANGGDSLSTFSLQNQTISNLVYLLDDTYFNKSVLIW